MGSLAAGGLHRWRVAARSRLSRFLECRSIRRHRSRLPPEQAGAYTDYLRHCRQASLAALRPAPAAIGALALQYEREGFTTLWSEETRRLADAMLQRLRRREERAETWARDGVYRGDPYLEFEEVEALFRGELGTLLEAILLSQFKIYSVTLLKSERTLERPTGSQLWHSDGGPGTCINLLFYLHETSPEYGALQCLPWPLCLPIFEKEIRDVRPKLEALSRREPPPAREELRDVKCAFYADEIARRHLADVRQPVGKAGLVVLFRNNCIHKGGFPEPGRARYAVIAHVYPGDRPTPFERYRRKGIGKPGSYPADPSADF